MTYDGVDHRFVYVLVAQHLLRLDAVLLGVKLKINIVKHADGGPVIDSLGVKFLCKLAHDLGNGLGMLEVERLFVELGDTLSCLIDCGDVAHLCCLLKNVINHFTAIYVINQREILN